jgi:hypothetical protein
MNFYLVRGEVALVSLLQVLQNVNGATDAAHGSCRLKSDLLSCRAD